MYHRRAKSRTFFLWTSIVFTGCQASLSGSASSKVDAGGASVEGSVAGEIESKPDAAPSSLATSGLRLDGEKIEYGAINFEHGYHALRDDEPTREALEAFAELMTSQPYVKIRVEGHTDSTGKAEANQALSEKRAKAVKTWLVEQGIAADRIETAGYGETHQNVEEGTECKNKSPSRVREDVLPTCEERWEQNRRAVFAVTAGIEGVKRALAPPPPPPPDQERAPRAPKPTRVDVELDGYRTGPWVYVGPGLAILAPSYTLLDSVQPAFQLFGGGGYMWILENRLMLAATFDMELSPMRYRPADGGSTRWGANGRMGPTGRIGYAWPRSLLYARVQPQLEVDFNGADFSLAVGAGFERLIAKRFAMGFEPGLDLDDNLNRVNGDLKLIFGWHF